METDPQAKVASVWGDNSKIMGYFVITSNSKGRYTAEYPSGVKFSGTVSRLKKRNRFIMYCKDMQDAMEKIQLLYLE